jgi:DNA-binding transcriptional MerR regulator
MIEDPLSTAEAAALLGVQPHTMRLWRMIKRGPLFFRGGYRSYWYARKDLLDWIEQHTSVP